MPGRSKAWVCGRSLAGIVNSNPAGGAVVCLLRVLCVVQVEVSASGRSLVQRSPTECGVSECDREVPSEEAINRNRVEAHRKIYIYI